MRKFMAVALLAFPLFGCDSTPSTESMQIKACVEDIKLGLNDPDSIEVLSTAPIVMDNGTYRIDLTFTAKNVMGGRVRGETICGFKTKNDVVLSPEDFMNQQRDLSRRMRKLGIN